MSLKNAIDRDRESVGRLPVLTDENRFVDTNQETASFVGQKGWLIGKIGVTDD
jgi:hypothetical protein